MANTEVIARLEGQIDHLVVEFNRIEEEKLQIQEMARGQYMIYEDDILTHHEHVQATTTCGSEEIVDDIVSELSLEDQVECFTQDGDNLNLDSLLGHAGILCESKY